MWKCHKCGKPVYFAERKQSLGYNWHPECLRCEECGKRLNPGQHAEHKGVPYCHVPCYGALFGPQLFGHGTRVESHKSFGLQRDILKVGNGPSISWTQVEAKLKAYNQFFEGRSAEVRSREVNGRLILEGSLRIHWGIQGVIHLKENDDQRTVVTVRKRNSCRISTYTDNDTDDDVQSISRDTSYNDISSCSDTTTGGDVSDLTLSDTQDDTSADTCSPDTSPTTPTSESIPKSVTLPTKLDVKNLEWDELDELLQVERKYDESDKMYQTMPVPLPSQSSTDTSLSTPTNGGDSSSSKTESCDQTNGTETLQNPTITNGTTPTTTTDDDATIRDDIWPESSNNHLNRSMSGPDCLGRCRGTSSPEFNRSSSNTTEDISSLAEAVSDVVIRRPAKTGSTAIRRRPGKRLSRSKVKRRCSINGHFYDRETSFFTPPHGSQMSVWVTSLVNTQEVVNLMLDKYKVDNDGSNFALFVVRDNGEQRRLKEDEYPLLTRVLLGPHEDVAKLFLMDGHNTMEVSSEVAQFLNLSLAECRAILNQYYSQEEKEVARLKEKYIEMKRRMVYRIEELKSSS